MKYQSYAKSSDTPNRKSRKGIRTSAFIANKKIAKALRKAKRLERKSLELGE